MSYGFEIKPGCKDEIKKHCRKNAVLENSLRKKISEIIEVPYKYKRLKYDLKNEYRVHILKSFVLIYEIDEIRKTVVFVQFSHHDDAYRR